MTINLSIVLPLVLGVLTIAGVFGSYLYRLASVVTRLEVTTSKLELVEKKTEAQAVAQQAFSERLTRMEVEQRSMHERLARLERVDETDRFRAAKP